MPRVIIFNAPPNAGKDIAASWVTMAVGRQHCEFKAHLFTLTKNIFGVSDEQWAHLYTRTFKEEPASILGGRSPREAMIFVSEEVIKPKLGDEYFGEYAANLVTKNTAFSDGGFISELQPMIRKHGEDNILIVRIHREGCDFSNDSRNYIPDGTVKNIIDVDNPMKEPCPHNDPTYFDFLLKIGSIADAWFDKGEIEWYLTKQKE